MYTWKGLAKGIYVWTRCDPAENIKKLCQSITTARTGDSPSSASDTSDCAQKEQHIRQSCILWIYIMAVWKARKLLNRAGWLSSAEPTIHRISASKSFKRLLKCSLSSARCTPTEQYLHQMHSDNSSYLQLQLAPSERQREDNEEDNGWGGRWTGERKTEATLWIGKLWRITSALHSSDGKSGQSLSITGANSHPPTQGSGKYSTAGSFSPFLRCNVVFISLQGRRSPPALLSSREAEKNKNLERFGNVLSPS